MSASRCVQRHCSISHAGARASIHTILTKSSTVYLISSVSDATSALPKAHDFPALSDVYWDYLRLQHHPAPSHLEHYWLAELRKQRPRRSPTLLGTVNMTMYRGGGASIGGEPNRALRRSLGLTVRQVTAANQTAATGPARDTRDRPRRGPPKGRRAPHRRARGVRSARTRRRTSSEAAGAREGPPGTRTREAAVHSRSAKLYLFYGPALVARDG